MYSSFSIRESLRFGWRTVRARSGLVFGAVLIFIACNLGQAVVQSLVGHNSSFALAWVFGFVDAMFALINWVVAVGGTLIALELADGRDASLRDIIPPWRLFVQSMASVFLVALMILAVVAVALGLVSGVALVLGQGIAADIIAGILLVCGVLLALYLMLRYCFVRFSAVDGERGISDILRQSADLTVGEKRHMLAFFVVLVFLNLLGALCVIVGLLLTIPVSVIAYAHVYVTLRGTKKPGSAATIGTA